MSMVFLRISFALGGAYFALGGVCFLQLHALADENSIASFSQKFRLQNFLNSFQKLVLVLLSSGLINTILVDLAEHL
jgi:hypothetical protein